MNPITKLEQKLRKDKSKEKTARTHKQVRQERNRRKVGEQP